ncbi:hypothetical protein P609_11260 [Comamonas thiooxydans]|nr:hypothetical protein P609_11260 [Comamonas thiooxydans]
MQVFLRGPHHYCQPRRVVDWVFKSIIFLRKETAAA